MCGQQSRLSATLGLTVLIALVLAMPTTGHAEDGGARPVFKEEHLPEELAGMPRVNNDMKIDNDAVDRSGYKHAFIGSGWETPTRARRDAEGVAAQGAAFQGAGFYIHYYPRKTGALFCFRRFTGSLSLPSRAKELRRADRDRVVRFVGKSSRHELVWYTKDGKPDTLVPPELAPSYAGFRLVRRGHYMIYLAGASQVNRNDRAFLRWLDKLEEAAWEIVRRAGGTWHEPEFRFEDVTWSRHNPFLISAIVKQKVDEQWKVPEKPVYVVALLKGRRLSRRTPPTRPLNAAYASATRRGVSPRRAPHTLYFERIRVDRSHGDRDESDARTGRVTVSLARSGRHAKTRDVRDGLRERGTVLVTYYVSGQKLAALWSSMKREAENPRRPGTLRGDVQLHAYRIGEDNEYEVLAESEPVPVAVDRVAELVVAKPGGREPDSIKVLRSVGVGSKPRLVAEFTEKVDFTEKEHREKRVRLIPGDVIDLGRGDYAEVYNLVNGPVTVGARFSAADYEGLYQVHIGPTGVQPPWGGELADQYPKATSGGVGFLASSGVGTVCWYFGLASLPTVAIGAGISTGVGFLYGWYTDDKLVWSRVEPDGTVMGFDGRGGVLNVYLIEGKATVRGASGEPVKVGEGEAVEVTKKSVSRPQRFRRSDLSPALRRALDETPRKTDRPTERAVIKKRFIVALDSSTEKQNAAFLRFAEDNDLDRWHSLPDFWLLADPRGRFTARAIREKADDCFPRVHKLVIRLDKRGDTWSGWGPNKGDRDMFEWLHQTWNKHRADAKRRGAKNKRFIVALGSTTKAQNEAFEQFIVRNGLDWWHWVEDVWLIGDPSGGFTARRLRDRAKEFFPDMDMLVIRLDKSGDRWSGVGSDEEFEWLRDTWSKYQDD